MAWSTAKAVISHLDQRFEAEKELLYWQHRLKSSRLDTLLSGVSLAIFWAYLELQRLNFPSPEDLDFQSILHLVGAFLLAIASSLSFLEVNLEFLWLPLACVYCAFLAQLRSDVRERLVCVAFAAAVSLTLPLRAATAWLVHLSALLGFAFSISELDAGMFALTGALLLLLVCNFYHSLWRAEARSRSVFLAGELVHQMCEVPDQDEMRGHYFESGKPEHAVLSLDTDLMIGRCGELERSFFQSDLFGRNLKELVSMEDQHMIGLLARSENPQRTILVKLMELGGSESVKLRLLPTGLQSPKWLAFFARGDAKTYVAPSSARDISSSISNSRASASSIRPASPRAMLPSVPDDAGNPSVTIKLETPAGPPAKPVELTPPAPGPPMQKRLSGSSVRSNHSILSEGRQLGERDKRRRRPSMDGIGNSPGLRWPKQGSNLSLGAEVESPRMRSEADLIPQQSSSGRQLRPVGEFNDSVLSLSAASWSIEPDYLRQVTPAKCLSDAQVQTEISWNKIGWHCKCTRPPRPPSPRQDREVQLERAVHRLQGCWLLTNGHVKTVGWLQGFVIRGMEVSTTSGIINLTIDDDNQLMLAGGHVSVDQDDVLHRTGKSGGSYTYVKVTEQRLSVMTLANQQGQQRPRLGSFDSLSSVLP